MFDHATVMIDGVRIHYARCGHGGEPVLLIHGFPQTWYEWHRLMPVLGENFMVIAPDIRGAGHSDKPRDGYDKHSLMSELRTLVHALGHRRVRIVGHDIGAMIAWRYAAVHPDEVVQLVLMDAPIPGTAAWAVTRANPRAWHINFHNARDVPEMLIAGRERDYIRYFITSRLFNPAAMPAEEVEIYAAAFAAPGAARAGFELYRALLQDAEDNSELLQTPLAVPTLMIAAGRSVIADLLWDMSRQIAADVRFHQIDKAGHWLCEEAPDEVADLIREFFSAIPPAR